MDAALERHLARRHLEAEGDPAHGSDALAVKRGAIVEARHAHAVLAQTLQIDIGGDHCAVGEALRLGETLAILIDQTLPVPGEVGRRFAEAGGRIDIGRDAFGRLAGTEHAPVLGLADGDVAGRQVHEHIRAGERGIAARRNRRPQILADLDMHGEVRTILGEEDQVVAEGDGPRPPPG